MAQFCPGKLCHVFLATGDQIVNAQLDKFVSISATHIYADGKTLLALVQESMLQMTLFDFQIHGKEPFLQAAGVSLVEEQLSELAQCTRASTAQLKSQEGCYCKQASDFIYKAGKLALSVHTIATAYTSRNDELQVSLSTSP